MRKKVTPRDIIVYILCLSVIFLVLVDSTYKLVYIKYNFWLMAGIIAGILVYITLIHRVKFAWISAVLLFLVPRPLFIVGFFKTFIKDLRGFVGSVIENQSIVQGYFNYFNNIVFIVLPILIIIFYIIVVVKKQTIPLMIFGGALISLYFYIGLKNLLLNCNIFLIVSFVLYSYNNFSALWNRWDKQRVVIGRGYFLRVIGTNLVLVLLVCLASNIAPINRAPISLGWFESEILNGLENLGTIDDRILSDSAYKSKFSLSYTGYQKNARRLGGPIEYDYSLALRIKSGDDIGGLHLRGTVKDMYNGYMWDKSDNKTTKIKGEIKTEDYTNEYKLKEMEIIHEGVRTTTAFNALYPYMLSNSYKYGFMDSDFEIFNPGVIRQGRGYSVKIKEFTMNQKALLAKGSYRDAGNDNSFKKYLELPNEIPARVYDLAEEITDEYTNPYMKASAIEHYLKTKYPYRRDTKVLPEGRDFVDYFLFDEEKGSCSYYASALAVMARMVDIPSRYVEGFVVPYSVNNEGYREVLNADAHAWVELYFEGAGWITFDPTPGGESSAYQFPQDIENNDTTSPEDTEGNNNTNAGGEEEDRTERTPEDIRNSAGNIRRKITWKQAAGYGAIGILSLGALLFIASVIGYILINKLIHRNKRIVQLSKSRMLLYGKLTYVSSNAGETLREYWQLLASKLQVDLDKYILIYEKNLYAKHKITREEKKEIIGTMLNTRKKVMEHVGKARFYYREYIDTLLFYIRNIKKGK